MDDLSIMMMEIQEHCSSSTSTGISLDSLKCDQPIIAQQAGDGKWYRAQVIGIDHDLHTANVQFVDYGTTGNVSPSQMCSIPPQFLSLPKQAITCCLKGIQPLQKEEEEGLDGWSKEATDAFERILKEEEGRIVGKISGIVRGSSLEVFLSTESCQDVATKLILAGLASKCE